MKTARTFQLIDHGIDTPSYFRGCGVADQTDQRGYSDVATGNGDNPAEAIADALDQLAEGGWDVDDLERRILAEYGWEAFPTEPSVAATYSDAEDLYYHVSILVSQSE